MNAVHPMRKDKLCVNGALDGQRRSACPEGYVLLRFSTEELEDKEKKIDGEVAVYAPGGMAYDDLIDALRRHRVLPSKARKAA